VVCGTCIILMGSMWSAHSRSSFEEKSEAKKSVAASLSTVQKQVMSSKLQLNYSSSKTVECQALLFSRIARQGKESHSTRVVVWLRTDATSIQGCDVPVH
jgi:hypothetical protein